MDIINILLLFECLFPTYLSFIFGEGWTYQEDATQERKGKAPAGGDPFGGTDVIDVGSEHVGYHSIHFTSSRFGSIVPAMVFHCGVSSR